jgi:hypothetical protein
VIPGAFVHEDATIIEVLFTVPPRPVLFIYLFINFEKKVQRRVRLGKFHKRKSV